MIGLVFQELYKLSTSVYFSTVVSLYEQGVL